MSAGNSEATVEALILEQLRQLTASVNDQGRILEGIKVNQQHQQFYLGMLQSDIEGVAQGQRDCAARNGFSVIKNRVLNVEKKLKSDPPPGKSGRITWGRIPLPTARTLWHLVPWLIAIGAGIATALGWEPQHIPTVPAMPPTSDYTEGGNTQ